jgi:PAS domain S-box-containing protein
MNDVKQISKKCLEAIVNHMPDPMFIIDMDGIVVAWNRAMEFMLKIPAEGVLGKHKNNLSMIFYGEERTIMADLLMEPNPENEAKYEKFCRKEDGTIEGFSWAEKRGLYLWVKVSPFYDLEGNVIGVMEITRDVTEIRKAEMKYKSLFGAMRTILDNVNLMIWAKDIDNRYTFVNNVYRDFLGLRSRDILGKTFHDFVQTDNDYSSDDTDERAKKETYIDTVPVVYKGTKHWLSICKSPLRDENNLLVGTVGTAKDITENVLKKEQAELEVASLRKEIERGVVEWRTEMNVATVEVRKNIDEIRKSLHGAVNNISNSKDDYWGKIL